MAEKLTLQFEVELRQQQLQRDTQNVLRQARALDRAFGNLNPRGASVLGRELRKSSLIASDLEKRIRGTTSATNNLGRQAQLTARRFIVYNIIAGIFFRLTAAVTEGLSAFVNFDTELNKARQILNPLLTNYNEFVDTIFEIGKAFGVSIKDVQSAQEIFIRQGKSQAEVTELTRASFALAAAAGFDFTAATEAITAATNQYSRAGLTAIEVADKFTAVSIRNAVTAGDLDQAVRRAGSAAEVAGVQFDNLVGFVTAAQESTRRGGAVIGTALRTIFTRIFRAPSIQALQELGIEVRKASGEFKDADVLIGELAGRFESLSQTQQLAIASTISGQRQIAILLAVLRNYKTAVKAADDATNSQGESARLTRIRQEALQVQLQRVTNQFQKFGTALGGAISDEIVSTISFVANAFEGVASAVSAASPVISGLVGPLTLLAVLFGAQLLGLGKIRGAYAQYKADLSRTRKEVELFRKAEDSKNKSANNTLKNRVRGVLGVSKTEAAAASQLALDKAQANARATIVQTQQVQLRLQENGNSLAQQTLKIEQGGIALQKLNNQLQDSFNDKKKVERDLEKNIQQLRDVRLDESTSTRNLTALQGEEKQLQKNLKLAEQNFARVFGTKDNAKAEGQTGGLLVNRDRIETARKLLQIEKEIAALRKSQTGQVNTRQAGIRDKLLQKENERRRLSRDLSIGATEAEEKENRTLDAASQKLTKNNTKRFSIQNSLIKLKFKEAALTQQTLTIEQKLAAIRATIANAEGGIVAQNFEIVGAKQQQVALEQELVNLQTRQGRLIKARTLQENKLATDIERNAEKTRAAQDGLFAGGRRTGIALGIGLAFNLAAEGIRDLGKESDKTWEAVAAGAETAGQVAFSAMLLPAGPLRALIIGIQVGLGIIKLYKKFTNDWGEELKKVQSTGDNLANTLAASKSIFTDILNITKQISLEGISVAVLNQINEQVKTMRTAFKDIPQDQFAKFEGDLRKAIRTNNVGEILKIQEALQNLSSENQLKGIIEKKAIEELVTAKNELLKFQKIINDTEQQSRAGDFVSPGIDGFTIIINGLEKTRGTMGKLNEETKDIRGSLVEAFTAATNSTESLRSALIRLDFEEIADATNLNDELALSYLRVKKGFDVVPDGQQAFKKAQKENVQLFDELKKSAGAYNSEFAGVLKGFRDSEQLNNKNAVLFFKLTSAVDTTSEAYRDFVSNLTLETQGNITDDTLAKTLDVLRENLVSGERAIRAYRTENGELFFQIDGIPGVIGPASAAYGFLNELLLKTGEFAAVASEGLNSVGEIQISNARITEIMAKRYDALSKSIERTAGVFNSIANNISQTTSLNSKLADSFPEEALKRDSSLLKAVGEDARSLGSNYAVAINALSKLDSALSKNIILLGDRIVQAYLNGQGATADYEAQLEVARGAVEGFGSSYVKLQKQLGDTQFGAGIEDLQNIKNEAVSLVTQLVALEQLAGSVLGLNAIQQKLTSEVGEIAAGDIDAINGFIAVLQQGFNVRQIDVGPDTLTNRGELAGQLDTLIKSLSGQVAQSASKEWKLAGQQLGQLLVEGTEVSISSGGDGLIQRVDTLLTEIGSKLAEKLREPIQKLRESFNSLEQSSSSVLSAIVSDVSSNLQTLSTLIAKGIIPPETTIADVLIGQFTEAQVAAEFAVKRVQAILDPLKKEELARLQIVQRLEARKREGVLVDQELLEEQEKLLNISRLVNAEEAERQRLVAEQKALVQGFNQVLLSSISSLGTAFKDVLNAQKEVAKGEVDLFNLRLSFVNEEEATTGQRLAIIQRERDAFERINRDVTGIENTNLTSLGDEIVRLTEERVKAAFKDPASAQFIQNRIDALTEQFNIEKNIADFRSANLQKELEILNKQSDAIRNLGVEFIKATDEQQGAIVRGGRLVDKFFGGIGATAQGGPNTGQVQSSIVNFLKNSNEETRNLVIGQLERLKAAGGEIAPGVSASNILTEMGNVVGDALFKNPAIKLEEEQVALQKQILSAQQDANELSRVNLRISEAQLRTSFTGAQSVVAKAIAQGETSTIDSIKGVAITRNSVQDVSNSVNELINKQREQIDISKKEEALRGQTIVTNKQLINTFEGVDLSTQGTQQSLEEFLNKQNDLRDAFISAEDAYISAQSVVTSALNNITQASFAAAKAQSEYTLGIELANRASIVAVGGFQTYRDEISFLSDAYDAQILSLQKLGATEFQISDLRIKLAQEQLSVFESQIENIRSNARKLLTSDTAATEFIDAGRAAALASDLARQAGIQPGQDATRTQQDAFAQLVLALPLEVRQALDQAFAVAPPGATAGNGFGIGQLENLTLSALGGAGEGIPDLVTLQREAAAQREIIARNSTDQLLTTQNAITAALDQLRTAQEGLLEARANKELAKMQLDSLQRELPTQTNLLGQIADGINRVANQTASFQRATPVGTASELLGVNAARGSLSGGEVGGLLRAAMREKAAMPIGSKLGVFNTSETVLTRGQVARLRGARSGTPNAQTGTAVIGGGNVEVLLQSINEKLARLATAGVTQEIAIDIQNRRNVTVEGLAGLQTALQDIISERIDDLYTREEAQAVQEVVQTIVRRLQQTGQISAIGT